MKHVAIVIGHGPRIDRGAVSLDKKVSELDWNTDLAHRIVEEIGNRLKATIVRRTTERLQPVLETNQTNADFAVELHLNSTPGASGTEMIHAANSTKGKAFAVLLQKAAIKALGLPDRGVKPPWRGRGERWLKGTRMPAVIVESFFVDNSNDLRVATEKKQQLAKAYADAMVEFAAIG